MRSPALTIYAVIFFDLRNVDSAQRTKKPAWQQEHAAAFQAASIERVRRKQNEDL